MKEKVLVFGGSGLVGTGFAAGSKDCYEIIAPTLNEVDVLDREQLLKTIRDFSGDVVINLVGYTAVDKAEEEVNKKDGLVFKLNVTAAANLSEFCKQENKYLVHISTAFVFDGSKEDKPYTEEDAPNPLNWYGKTKYLGEQAVAQSGCKFVIVRIDMPYCAGYSLKSDFFRFFLEKMKLGEKVAAINDQKITPTYIPDLVEGLHILITQKVQGIFHIGSANFTTPFDFAKKVAEKFNFDNLLVEAVTFEKISEGRKAVRPRNSWMDCSKMRSLSEENILHTTQQALDLLKEELA